MFLSATTPRYKSCASLCNTENYHFAPTTAIPILQHFFFLAHILVLYRVAQKECNDFDH